MSHTACTFLELLVPFSDYMLVSHIVDLCLKLYLGVSNCMPVSQTVFKWLSLHVGVSLFFLAFQIKFGKPSQDIILWHHELICF
jgi:hypothetical protein